MMSTAMTLAPKRIVSKETVDQYIPQLQVDQMRAVTRHLRNMHDEDDGFETTNRLSDDAVDFDNDLMPLEIHRLMQGNKDEVLKAATTSRRKVMSRTDWKKFKAAEETQLTKRFGHNIYGDLIPRHKLPQGSTGCHQIWSYYIKPNGDYKARDCLNGKKLTRMGTLYRNTYNICVTWMPAAFNFFAICAVNNFSSKHMVW